MYRSPGIPLEATLPVGRGYGLWTMTLRVWGRTLAAGRDPSGPDQTAAPRHTILRQGQASEYERLGQTKTPPQAGLRGDVRLAVRGGLCNSASRSRAAFTGRQGVMRRREILAAACLFLFKRASPMTGLVTP